MSLLSLLQLCTCQLSCLRVFDVVFHFGLVLTQTSLGSPLDARATKNTLQKLPLSQSSFSLYLEAMFSLFIMEVQKKEKKGSAHSCPVVVFVFLQGVIVHAVLSHFYP